MSDHQRGLVYLITGGSGFLGKHLVRLLLEKEGKLAEIRVFDKNPDPRLSELSTGKTRVEVIQGDITDYSRVLEASRGVDVIVHTASLVDVWHKIPESVMYSVNVKGTENVLRACVECGVTSLIYTSSMHVVGPNDNKDQFIRGNEDTPYDICHCMAYPITKAQAETMVLKANGTEVRGHKRLYTCALRPTGVYGDGDELIRGFYKQCVQRGGLAVQGIPEHIEHGRVYAGNVAWMHILAAQALRERPDALGGEAFYCYDDSPYKSYEEFNLQFLSTFNFRRLRIPLLVLWFLAIVNDVLRWMLSPVYSFTPLLNRYTYATVSTSFTVSTDKAFRHFQYRPLYSWDQCKARTQEWVDSFAQDKAKDV